MITFDKGEARFNFRVAGIALNGHQVLIHRSEMDDFWSLPGGRVEMLEPARDALEREMLEELDVEIQVERLVWVVENFFEYDSKPYHELAFYFLMKFPRGCHLYNKHEPFLIDDEGVRFIFKWYPISKLKDIRLYPAFLRKSFGFAPGHYRAYCTYGLRAQKQSS
jgi:ADP-ribose pyrophosphatase YjhB (NUDIX family)